jgi:DNA repair protein RadC
VHSREVFHPAIRHGATAIILAHNHPSGDPTPSAADFRVTKEILKSSTIVNIDLLDHIIIGETENCPNSLGFYSFSEAGVI